MTLPRSFVRPLVRPMVRSGAVGPYGGATYQDGIHLNFASGNTTSGYYVKAVGAAPTVSPLTSLFTFTGGNQSMYMGPAGLLVASATNTPRIEYDASGNCLGLLMEAARTNLWLQSQTFDNASWTKLRSSVSADTIAAPDGTTTADTFVEDGSAATTHLLRQDVTVVSGTAYTATIWAKAKERTQVAFQFGSENACFNFEAGIFTLSGSGTAATLSGSPTAVTIQAFPNGWYRCRVSATAAASAVAGLRLFLASGGTTTYSGDNASGAYIWGAQLEAGAFASSYIPTTTVFVARTADRCIRALSSEFSASTGTFAVVGDITNSVGATPAIFAAHNNAGTGAEEMILYANAGARRWLVTDGGVAQGNVLGGSISDGVAGKMACVYAANDLDLAVNGTMSGLQDTSATLPTITHLDLMRQDASAISLGHILRFDYWPERKANAFLVSAST